MPRREMPVFDPKGAFADPATVTRTTAHFDGETYEPVRDHTRLSGQLREVFLVMRDGKWRTLQQIRDRLDRGTEAAISARLRDFRKPKFGGYDVKRDHLGHGLYRYRLVKPQKARTLFALED